ncbi:germination protein YpeB [Paenibacillus sp. L3-i20]|uniref:germination protein YpeB n=1 Tax=Paenibacillus sp. L3-i20 TaxID=2905833 RepID=UPI001EE0FE97|nr:germination protein YpeB [Paenibacillus sp. L3-i20]GKU79567.1 germination protein YpeB [Paenibacillus sp. L3-i20]
MYRRLSSVMFPLVTILLIGAIYWGYQEHQEKNSILIKAENQYQRAFHDLTLHIEKVHEQLGNTLAVNSTSGGYHRKGLVNVWRLTSQAQNEISQLPLSYLPFTEAEDFLSHISNFAYKTAVRDLTKQPLSKDEFNTLQTLYTKSDEIAKDLHNMQKDVLSNRLRWMDVELAIASDKEAGSNAVADGLRSVDKKVGSYPELNWGPSVSSMYAKRTIKMLGGEMVTTEHIQKKAAEFLKVDQSQVRVAENAKGTEYASYSALVNEKDPNQKVQMDFTQKGGQLIWYMKSRELGSPKIDYAQAKASADAFLVEHGFKDMRAISYDHYNNSASFTFVGTQNDVLIYPEKLTVKIALDNGEAVGLQANDFVYEHHKRELKQPTLSKEEAKKAINPAMNVTNEEQALIINELGEETLCYEYTGQINGAIYRIYINGDTGIEETIEVMTKQDKDVSKK